MCPIVLRQPGGSVAEFLPHDEDAGSVGGDGATRLTRRERRQRPAPGLVTPAPLPFLLKLYPLIPVVTAMHCTASV